MNNKGIEIFKKLIAESEGEFINFLGDLHKRIWALPTPECNAPGTVLYDSVYKNEKKNRYFLIIGQVDFMKCTRKYSILSITEITSQIMLEMQKNEKGMNKAFISMVTFINKQHGNDEKAHK